MMSILAEAVKEQVNWRDYQAVVVVSKVAVAADPLETAGWLVDGKGFAERNVMESRSGLKMADALER